MPMTNAAEYLERTAARVPDKVAFSDASGSLTFAAGEITTLHDAVEAFRSMKDEILASIGDQKEE